MTATVLVFNAGSSSIEYELIDSGADGGGEQLGSSSATIASGLCERVGRDDTVLHHRVGDAKPTIIVAARDHAGAVRTVLDAFAVARFGCHLGGDRHGRAPGRDER